MSTVDWYEWDVSLTCKQLSHYFLSWGVGNGDIFIHKYHKMWEGFNI